MANRNSKYGRKRGSFKIFWLVIAIVTSGGVSGFLNPDWPVVGPLVTSVKTQAIEYKNQTASGLEDSGVNNVQANPEAYAGTPVQSASALGPNDKILIATFNIQVFGESKLRKPDAMAVIVEVIRKFDVIAIQEVRAKADDILPRLVAELNADGSRYAKSNMHSCMTQIGLNSTPRPSVRLETLEICFIELPLLPAFDRGQLIPIERLRFG